MVQDLVTNQRKKLGLVQTGMCCNSTQSVQNFKSFPFRNDRDGLLWPLCWAPVHIVVFGSRSCLQQSHFEGTAWWMGSVNSGPDPTDEAGKRGWWNKVIHHWQDPSLAQECQFLAPAEWNSSKVLLWVYLVCLRKSTKQRGVWYFWILSCGFRYFFFQSD